MNKFLFVFLGALFFSFKCNHSPHPLNRQQLRAVHITGSLPAITADTSFTISNSYDIFYFGDLIMYRFRYRFDSLNNGQLVFQEFRPNFFVFHKDSLFGYSFYPIPHRLNNTGRISIDTMFKRNAIEPYGFDSAFHYKPDTLYFDEEKNLVKVYKTHPSEKYPETASYYLYFSKKLAGLNDSFFSRSSMDNEKGMKLFKIRIVLHGHYYEEYKLTLPQREVLYEMTEIPVKNESEILQYFDKYKRAL